MSAFVWLTVLAALAAAALCVVVWRRWSAARQELVRLRATFSRYVAPAVVDVLLARKDERLFTGKAVRATILVCRIRNFAHFIEPLSPEETLRYLNEFYGLAGTAIQRHRGIIDAFLGDGVIGVFGSPLENPTQEDDALRAALDVVRHIVAMRERWASQNRKPFTVGIGINTGEVIAGDAGYRDRREFTVVGSEVVYAHRLQEAAFSLNAFIVASRATCEAYAHEYKLVPITPIPLPGVRRLLDAFVVRGRTRGPERFTLPTDALVETQIVAESPPPPPPPPIATPPKPAKPPPVARPRPRATAAPPGFGAPESASKWLFPQEDAAPIMPDPPRPRTTYEDRDGSLDL
ncbi:MAG TPA: adenylate/guanylate cyclase domain-containing protein [Candidatus Elarobacter sp.]